MNGQAGDIEQALDELFGADLDDSISQRARPAKQLLEAQAFRLGQWPVTRRPVSEIDE